MRRSTGGHVALVASLIVVGLSLAEPVGAEGNPRLRYGFQSGRKYTYQVRIIAEIQDLKATEEGSLTLDILSASEDQFVMKGSANLSRNVPRLSDLMPGPPMPMGPPRVPVPFGPSFEVQKPENWTLSRLGSVVVRGDDAQLLFLLGYRDLLVIEPFPADPRPTWSIDGDVGVLEKSSRGPGFFGPEFAEETWHGAKERTDYAVIAATPECVRLSKKYSLTTAKADSGGVQFTMTGSGELEFDLKEGVFRSSSMKYELQIRQKNLTLVLPLTFGYRLGTRAELAAQDERMLRAAEAAEYQPLRGGERVTLLSELRSSDEVRAIAALKRLEKSTVGDNPDEISAALVPYLKHPNDRLQVLAAKALKVWATGNAEADLIEASRSENLWLRGPAVEALGRIKTPAAAEAAATQLRRNRFEACKALRAIGTVAEMAARSHLNDPDPEVRDAVRKVLNDIAGNTKTATPPADAKGQERQPDRVGQNMSAGKDREPLAGGNAAKDVVPVPAAPEAAVLRTWRDVTGTYSIEAGFVTCVDNRVTLRRNDGRTITIPIDKLSPPDQDWVKRQGIPKPPNPFE